MDTGEKVMPTFLGSRKYADFHDDALFDEELENLLASLNKEGTVSKPLSSKASVSAPASPAEVPVVKNDPAQTYAKALTLIKTGDMLGWRKSVQELKRTIKPALFGWRDKYEKKPPQDITTLNVSLPVSW